MASGIIIDHRRFAKFKQTRTVQKYLDDPTKDVNRPISIYGYTILHCMIRAENIDGIKLLLTHPQIDLNRPNFNGGTPIMVSCGGSIDTMKFLLSDHRFDLNHEDDQGHSLLDYLLFYHRSQHVQWLFAIRGEDITLNLGKSYRNLGGASSIFRISTPSKPLLENFRDDPKGTVSMLRKKLGYIPFNLIGRLFGLVVLASDGFLSLTESPNTDGRHRFFRIMTQFPMELQMVICHRVYGSSRNNVKSSDFSLKLY